MAEMVVRTEQKNIGMKLEVIKNESCDLMWFLTNDFTLHLGDGKSNVVSHARSLENWT